jgi:hypothetical protein
LTEDVDTSTDHDKTVHLEYLLGISLPVNTTNDMSTPSIDFLENSETLSDETPYMDAYEVLIDYLLLSPHEIAFDSSEISSIVQPDS